MKGNGSHDPSSLRKMSIPSYDYDINEEENYYNDAIPAPDETHTVAKIYLTQVSINSVVRIHKVHHQKAPHGLLLPPKSCLASCLEFRQFRFIWSSWPNPITKFTNPNTGEYTILSQKLIRLSVSLQFRQFNIITAFRVHFEYERLVPVLWIALGGVLSLNGPHQLGKPYFPKKLQPQNHTTNNKPQTKLTPTFSPLLYNQTWPNSVYNHISTQLEDYTPPKP